MSKQYTFDAFLSYTSEDYAFVAYLSAAQKRRGVRVWLDREQIGVSERFVAKLEHGLENSRALVRIVTPESVGSNWIRDEFDMAKRLANDGRLRIIPLILRKTKLSGFLANHQEIDFEVLYTETKNTLKHFPYQDEGVNSDMIRHDFPTLSDREIGENIDVIDEYYTRNLNQEVARRYVANITKVDIWDGIVDYPITIKTPKIPYIKKFRQDGESKKSCILRLTEIGVKGKFAMLLASKVSEKDAYNKFPNLSSSSTQRDAYRHTLWSALLAKYYFTVSAKSPRLKFAKKMGDRNEDCGDNTIDDREMDYHNNAIGREIWDDNASYKKVKWVGWIYGLNNPSVETLKAKVLSQIQKAKFIDKDALGGSKKNKEVKTYWAIKALDENKSVYISNKTGNDKY